MRAILLAAVLAVALVGSASADPLPAAYQPGAFPRDETSLRDLDSQQLRIVRRAGAQCWHSLEGGFRSRSATARACVISLTENAVRNSENEPLQAYHNALPFTARYNEYRPAHYWQRFVARD
jgi:hypothetical protein